MRRVAIVATLTLVVLAVTAQFVVPRIAAHGIESRLTRGGGSAQVHLSALPWPRLLFGEGDLARVRARGIALEFVPAPNGKLLSELDGFGEVDVRITGARAGPLALREFRLERSGGELPYRATIHGTITARDLATFSGDQAAGSIGGFLGGLAGSALPFGNRPLPVDLAAVVRSDAGHPVAVAVDGTVAGVPAGPLVEALAQALAGRF